MKSFFIITNLSKDPELKITGELEKYLKKKGCKFSTQVCENKMETKGYTYTNPDTVPKGVECVIVIGGDGTLLHAARDLVSKKLPMIGINSGKLGYLAEIERNAIESTMERLINEAFQIETRMMLKGELVRDGEVIKTSIALNDIILSRSGSLRIADYKVCINGQFLNVYSADGIIVSTPTGATAYNLSAGGPIAQPSSSIMIMTPICAHTLNSRSIVFSEDAVIEIEMFKDKNVLAFDGDLKIDMVVGDKIVISKSELSTKIIKLSSMSFLELLRKKMS